jgi:hypothetical protein
MKDIYIIFEGRESFPKLQYLTYENEPLRDNSLILAYCSFNSREPLALEPKARWDGGSLHFIIVKQMQMEKAMANKYKKVKRKKTLNILVQYLPSPFCTSQASMQTIHIESFRL